MITVKSYVEALRLDAFVGIAGAVTAIVGGAAGIEELVWTSFGVMAGHMLSIVTDMVFGR